MPPPPSTPDFRPVAAVPRAAPRRPTLRFLFAHPAHLIALGLGSGLAPVAPGTVGTLWAWVAFLAVEPWLSAPAWAAVLAASAAVGWWACTVTARHLRVADPGAIVWDEVLAFWLVLTLVMPAGFAAQCAAFALFRFFDAAKPGPVGWADGLWKPVPGADRRPPVIGWAQGFTILFDDLVAALCTLLVIALWKVA